MGVIKPTITLTANASSATTDAGPLSIALSLSATDSLTVTKVETKILDVKSDHTASTDAGPMSVALSPVPSNPPATDLFWTLSAV